MVMSTDTILLSNIVMQSQGNVASDMDGEKVMLSISSGKYYNLGKVGGAIWDLIQNPISVADLIQSLTQRYDVAPESCRRDVISFLNDLKAEGLICLPDSVHS
ncbi:lasso peptide biosynthesis PqqD family chaperone [Sporolactobacillus sp. THM7-4]|nr:lasso peptide biosynthesis PqqD family chaperone [Sporolactobacillus sp. THM7-4]